MKPKSLPLGGSIIDSAQDRLLGAYHSMNGEVDSGKRAGLPSRVAEKITALERENRELRLDR